MSQCKWQAGRKGLSVEWLRRCSVCNRHDRLTANSIPTKSLGRLMFKRERFLRFNDISSP
jgi:hypothetical protein